MLDRPGRERRAAPGRRSGLPAQPLVVQPVESVGTVRRHLALRPAGRPRQRMGRCAPSPMTGSSPLRAATGRRSSPTWPKSWEVSDGTAGLHLQAARRPEVEQRHPVHLRRHRLRRRSWCRTRGWRSRGVSAGSWTNPQQPGRSVEGRRRQHLRAGLRGSPTASSSTSLAGAYGLTIVVARARRTAGSSIPKYNPGRRGAGQGERLRNLAADDGRPLRLRHRDPALGQPRAAVHERLEGHRAAARETSTRLVFERNPYYWKVDPQGNPVFPTSTGSR